MSASASNIAVVAAIISACAAIASAGISGVMSWSVSRRSASQKIAEFRKEWIENLRVHFSEFSATWFILAVLSRRIESLDPSQTEERTRAEEELKAKYERLRYLDSYIAMMLNPAEDLHRQMSEHITLIVKQIVERKNSSDPAASEESPPLRPKFTELARKILKAEWDRLKLESK